jgi:2-polyprenyl-6-methoxyphenol hydroxylase-like FAD-dependent oxidoreductase
MYDAIVIGARCAGSPTAMLLARKGYKVLLLDKDSFPSDTISTHIIWPHAAELMDRWGLLDRLAATGCPPIARKMKFDVGPFALVGGIDEVNGGRGGFCPRRTVLDKILVDAAVESGADLRENFTVDELLWEGEQVVGIKGHSRNQPPLEERARIVIGADGVHSFVAKAVQATEYNEIATLATYFYSYFSGIEIEDIEQYLGLDHAGPAYFPTNDGLTLVAAVWPAARFKEIRQDIEGNVLGVHRQIPMLAQRLEGARREEQWYGTAGVPNVFRKPFGPGWALVGDASYVKDPITAQGISDGFIEAQNLSDAIDDAFSDRRPLAEGLAEYEANRNERVTPLFHFTCELASLEPPPPAIQQLFGAMHGNQRATNQFFGAITGAIPLPEFMDPENIGRIMAESGAAGTPA